MDADQLDLKIIGHVVTPGRVLEDGWIGVRGEIVAAGGVTTIIEMPHDAEAPVAVCLAALAAAVIRLDEELAP
jgi:hypothetical protein